MPWIKVRTDLHDDPRVGALARMTGLPVPHVVGALVRLWSFADAFSTDGRLRFTDADRVDSFAGLPPGGGFADSLLSVGWLGADGDGLFLPRFAEHNGESAKARAQGARRVERHRNADSVSPCNAASVTERNAETVTRGEERRVEKRARARGVRGGGL